MSHAVFVSYSSHDQATAAQVVAELEAAGIRCWIAPRDIKAGDVWAHAIVDAIAAARVFVLVFSAHANRSGHVLNELDAAVRRGATVIPVRIENVMPDRAMEYHLQSRHWLDVLEPNRPQGLANLKQAISTVLGDGSRRVDELTRIGPLPPPPQPPRSVRRSRLPLLAALGVALLAMAGFGFWRLAAARAGPVFTPFDFRASTAGSEFRTTIRPTRLRFFEGPQQTPVFNQRRYGLRFTAAQTRYIYTEVTLELDPPGRPIYVPLACTIYGPTADNIEATFTLGNRIAGDASSWYNSYGWGRDPAGAWKPGSYRAECLYGQKVVARAGFEVLE